MFCYVFVKIVNFSGVHLALNKDTRSTSIMERVDTDPYHSFKFYMKVLELHVYQKECIIVNCYVCRRLKINDL